jgi:prephenate dehydrogenase
MAGKETPGITAAQADLFDGATYCIVPSKNAAPEALDAVAAMASAIGATPFFLEATEHDSYAAAVSHLPFLAAISLVNTVIGAPTWRDMSKVASTGFRDTTRLASGDVQVHADICRSNAESIAHWLDTYINQLTALREAVVAEGRGLDEYFQDAKKARDAWMEQDATTENYRSEIPASRDSLRQMLFGGRRVGKDKEKK